MTTGVKIFLQKLLKTHRNAIFESYSKCGYDQENNTL
jgi:hypothetical protein